MSFEVQTASDAAPRVVRLKQPARLSELARLVQVFEQGQEALSLFEAVSSRPTRELFAEPVEPRRSSSGRAPTPLKNGVVGDEESSLMLMLPEVARKKQDTHQGRTSVTRGVAVRLRLELLANEKTGVPTSALAQEGGFASKDVVWKQLKRVWAEVGLARVEGVTNHARYFPAWDWSKVRPWAKRAGTVTPQALGLEYWIGEDEARTRLQTEAPAWLTRGPAGEEWTFKDEDHRPHAQARGQEKEVVLNAGQPTTPTHPAAPVSELAKRGPEVVELSLDARPQHDAFAGYAFAKTFRQSSLAECVWIVTNKDRSWRSGVVSLRAPHEMEPVQLKTKQAFAKEEDARKEAARDSARTKQEHYAVALSTTSVRERGFLVGRLRDYPGHANETNENALLIVSPPEGATALNLRELAVEQVLLSVEPRLVAKSCSCGKPGDIGAGRLYKWSPNDGEWTPRKQNVPACQAHAGAWLVLDAGSLGSRLREAFRDAKKQLKPDTLVVLVLRGSTKDQMSRARDLAKAAGLNVSPLIVHGVQSMEPGT